MKKKFLVIGATVVLALSTLTGCGSKETSNTSTEATVTDAESGIGKVAEKVSSEAEDTTEEVSAFDEDACNSSFHYLDTEFVAYKEGAEFVCGDYVFNVPIGSYPTCTVGDGQELALLTCDYASEKGIDYFEGFDSYEDEVGEGDYAYTFTYTRTGDTVEFTNADGNKIKMYPVERTSSSGDESNKLVFITVDNGITLMLLTTGVEITQDEFEKFLPLTEGWITNQ